VSVEADLDFERLLHHLTPQEQEELNALLAADFDSVPWRPLAGPQTLAYESRADIIGYGGAAGGGKTDLLCGKATTQHTRVLIVRREKAQTAGIVQRLTEILGSTTGYNSQQSQWRLGSKLLEFAGLDNPGDERRWQGRPHDLKAFDEVTEMREHQVRFIMGWNRSNEQGQLCQVLMTFNPPTTPEGRWVVAFFGPWLDRTNRFYPTAPGVLRYAAMLPDQQGGSRDVWVDGPEPFVLDAEGQPLYDFDPAKYTPQEVITPRSRTFFPAKVTDNAFYMATGYISVLQSLPEPLRSQMLNGDFTAGMQDDPWQVIPTEWVRAAQARWRKPDKVGELMSLGVDVARGGKDKTVVSPRCKSPDGTSEHWFAELQVTPGKDTPNGPTAAATVIPHMRDAAPTHIDVNGVGASPYDFLRAANLPVYGVLMQEGSNGFDRASGKLGFSNVLSEIWWRLRETLDPANNTGAALPPDEDLAVELCLVKWKFNGKVISVQPREEVIDKTGRSPDRATAVALANIATPKVAQVQRTQRAAAESYDPYASFSAVDYDPYKD
jgi:hypothetical protein